MKTKLFILICLAALIAAGSFSYQHIYKYQVLILKNGQNIITEDSWVVGDSLFYKTEDDTHSISLNRIADIKRRGIVNKGYGIVIIVKHHLAPWKQKTLDFTSRASMEKAVLKKWAPGIGAVTIGLLLCIILFYLAKKNRRALKPKKPQTETPGKPVENKKIYEGREQIADFFLSVFKAQKGVDPSTEASFHAVDSNTKSNGNNIYELRIKSGNDWTRRRMTIGPIGEDSGSRSTCYYVIYDDHIVIKVAPTPYTDFTRYIQGINRDNQIAEKLSPRECLVPRVSVILKKIHPLHEDSRLPIEQLEGKYIQWLGDHPEFQNYLKIGGGFAYFMDLSRYFFLGHILHHIHGIDGKIGQEISKHPDHIWNPVNFEDRYGTQHTDICDRLNPVYTSFHNRVHELLHQTENDETVSEFKIKEWFLIYLSGQKLTAADFGATPRFVLEINNIALKVFNNQRQAVQCYQEMIRAFVVTKNLNRHSSQISSMIINLLDLLFMLNDKKLAMRDLKPDNLLVAGNPTKFPQFLESASMYSIGLIDVETAVSYDTSQNDPIRQPPLGGTPAYATPVHQLKNETIQTIYKDLPFILHLQDWYATVAMIYQTVTGERLFKATAKNLLKLKKIIREQSRTASSPRDMLKTVSHAFWKTAITEFRSKTQKNKKQLGFISLIVGQESKTMLLSTIANTHQHISKSVHKLIQTQTSFKGEKIQKSLYAAAPLKIHHFKIKFAEERGKQLSPEARDAALKVLDDLSFLKRQSEQLVLASTLIKKSVPIISSFDLLKTMFIVVLVNMHQNCWGIVSHDD